MKKVALVTGAAKRIGAVIAEKIHAEGFNVIIHYHHSEREALVLTQRLNQQRDHSAVAIQGDIKTSLTCKEIIKTAYQEWQRLDILINNASSFYPTPMGEVNDEQWDDLMGSNLKGPFFLSQAAAPYLQKNSGVIVNIVDIHADRPLKNYPVYCMAKAGLTMLTKALARELAPEIRVNAVAPGVILWPNQQNTINEAIKDHIIDRTCLKRQGLPQDIAETILFLIKQNYMTGQVIAVDGGRSIKD